jgi:hypothetical protein
MFILRITHRSTISYSSLCFFTCFWHWYCYVSVCCLWALPSCCVWRGLERRIDSWGCPIVCFTLRMNCLQHLSDERKRLISLSDTWETSFLSCNLSVVALGKLVPGFFLTMTPLVVTLLLRRLAVPALEDSILGGSASLACKRGSLARGSFLIARLSSVKWIFPGLRPGGICCAVLLDTECSHRPLSTAIALVWWKSTPLAIVFFPLRRQTLFCWCIYPHPNCSRRLGISCWKF